MLGVSVKFPKKRAFVTGAASGLGRALCRQLARDGWKIALCDVNEARLKEAADEVQGLGGDAFTYVLDVTDRRRAEQQLLQWHTCYFPAIILATSSLATFVASSPS